jgi:hypothetical protein
MHANSPENRGKSGVGVQMQKNKITKTKTKNYRRLELEYFNCDDQTTVISEACQSSKFWSRRGTSRRCMRLHAELDVNCPQDNGDVLWCAGCGGECGCAVGVDC